MTLGSGGHSLSISSSLFFLWMLQKENSLSLRWTHNVVMKTHLHNTNSTYRTEPRGCMYWRVLFGERRDLRICKAPFAAIHRRFSRTLLLAGTHALVRTRRLVCTCETVYTNTIVMVTSDSNSPGRTLQTEGIRMGLYNSTLMNGQLKSQLC